MAVLVGILAPQFIKYVEKSRQSTDIKNGQELIQVVNAAAADAATTSATTDDINSGTITITTTAITATDAGTTAAITAAGLDTMKLKSSKWTASGTGGAGKVVITVTVAGDKITFTSDPTTFAIQ